MDFHFAFKIKTDIFELHQQLLILSGKNQKKKKTKKKRQKSQLVSYLLFCQYISEYAVVPSNFTVSSILSS